MKLITVFASACVLLSFGCSSAEQKRLSGDTCEINSECETPFVCRLSLCRQECATSRDCPAGLNCLLDEDHFGACQVPAETHCVLPSDCSDGLVCKDAQCINVCVTDADCAAGATCKTASGDSAAACVDSSTQACAANSDCLSDTASDLVCARDGQCRAECVIRESCAGNARCENTDCLFEEVCEDSDADGAGRCVPRTTSQGHFVAATGIAVGFEHVLATFAGSMELLGWGSNSHGQLASTFSNDLMLPTSLHLEYDAPQTFAAGKNNSCATFRATTGIATGIQLYCWGANDSGQVGTGSAVLDSVVSAPSLVPMSNQLTEAVTIGLAHVCAIVGTEHTAYCWGDNSFGQCGDNSNLAVTAPRSMDLASVVSIDAGTNHTCATDSAGLIYCWGANTDGQVNAAADVANVTTPTLIPFPPIATSATTVVSAGAAHTCAVVDGLLYCWGRNSAGELGNGPTSAASLSPMQATVFADGTIFKSVTAGNGFTCALTDTNDVYCFGRNQLGQLGNDTRDDSSDPVLAFSGADWVQAGDAFVCAHSITTSALYCWGSDEHAQLGNGMNGTSVGFGHAILVSP